jgi:hypothetical protein
MRNLGRKILSALLITTILLSFAHTNSADASSTSDTTDPAYGIGNIAFNKTVYASSDLSDIGLPGYEPDKAVDSSMGTCWIASQARPQWIIVDLGQCYRLDQIRWASTNQSHFVTYKYYIEGSNDMSDINSWVMLADKRDQGDYTNGFSVDNVTGNYRYVRLTVTAIECEQDGDSHGTSVSEFEVYAVPPPAEEGEPAPLPHQHWILNTADTQITLAIYDNKPTIFTLQNVEQKWNWTYMQSSIPLVSKVVIDNTEYVPDWVFSRAVEDDTNGKKVTLVFTSTTPALTLESTWYARPGTGPVEHWMRIHNQSGSCMTIYQQESLDINVKGSINPILWYFHKESAHPDTKGIYKETLSKNANINIYTNTQNGSNTNGFIPLIYLDENESHGLYIGWEWPEGRINVSTSYESLVTVNVKAGLNNNFKTDIENDQYFDVPTVYIGAYNGDVDQASNVFKKWFVRNKIPSDMLSNPNEPLMQVDDQGFQRHNDLKSWGIDAIKWDYGWWPGEQNPIHSWMRSGEGDWRLGNPVYISHINSFGANNVNEYSNLINQWGLKWTLYVLFHDSRSTDPNALSSVGPNAHPEWFSNTVITDGASADLGNPDCVAWIKDRLTNLMQDWGVTTYRSDFEPISMNSDKINNHKYNGIDTAYWCAKGFYEILDHLRANVPNFRYECCGSGGSLKDFATLSRANVIQFNDTSVYTDIRKTFYDSSFAIPSMQLQAPGMLDHFMNQDETEAHYGWRSIIMGASESASSDGTQKLIPGTDEYYLEHYAKMYRDKIRPLVRNADLYHILPRPDEIHWDGIEYYDPNSQNDIVGAVFLFKPTNTDGPTKTIRLKGLDPNEIYALEFEDRSEQNTIKTGAELMDGFEVTIAEDRGSDIIWLRKQISCINVSTMPTKTTYFIGDTLDVSGGKITVTDRDGVTQIVDMTSDMVSGFESRKSGEKTVTVSYLNKTTQFTITVLPSSEVPGNLALGKTVTASSLASDWNADYAPYSPDTATDGNLDGYFYCPDPTKPMPQWLIIDLEDCFALNRINWISTNPSCMATCSRLVLYFCAIFFA